MRSKVVLMNSMYRVVIPRSVWCVVVQETHCTTCLGLVMAITLHSEARSEATHSHPASAAL